MRTAENLLLFFMGVLIFVWPIPHTISVREISLGASFGLATYLVYRNRISLGPMRPLRTTALLYAAFVAWAAVVALLVSNDALWSLNEIRTQWAMGTLALALGAETALLLTNGVLSREKLFLLLFVPLFAHVVFINADGAMEAAKSLRAGGGMELTYLTRNVKGLAKGPIEASVAADILMTMLLAEAFARAVYKKTYLPVGRGLLAAGLLLALAASFFCGLRNIIEILSVAASAAIVLLAGGRLRERLPLFALVLVFLAFISISFVASDSRWTGLKKSIELAWTTDYYWNEKPDEYLMEPVKGEKVSTSNYLRFEIYRKSLDIIRHNPLGTGFGRSAFGRALMREHGGAAGMSAESAVLDILIGTGFVGVALWIAACLSLLLRAAARVRKSGDFPGLWMLFLLISFGARMVVDSVLDTMLHQFMFMAGMLAVMTAREKTADAMAAGSEPAAAGKRRMGSARAGPDSASEQGRRAMAESGAHFFSAPQRRAGEITSVCAVMMSRKDGGG